MKLSDLPELVHHLSRVAVFRCLISPPTNRRSCYAWLVSHSQGVSAAIRSISASFPVTPHALLSQQSAIEASTYVKTTKSIKFKAKTYFLINEWKINMYETMDEIKKL